MTNSKLPKADKDLGQHFLKDKNVIQNITTDFADESDVIVEIGPGPAILSKDLSNKEKPYFFIEKDERFKEQLSELTPLENQNFCDALKFNWDEFIAQKDLTNKKIWLVSNLPYNISSALLISFLKVSQIKYMTLMFQKEVGEKTFFREGAKNQMGSLLMLTLNYFNSKKLMNVRPGAFLPPPKVESIVVSYERVEAPKVSIQDFKTFEKFLRLTFSMRRKQLGSVYKSSLTKEVTEKIFKDSEIVSTTRAEALSIDQIFKLYNSYKANI